jgi:hypothetical protein
MFTPETVAVGTFSIPTGTSNSISAPCNFTITLPFTVSQINRPEALTPFSGFSSQQLSQTTTTEATVPQTTPPTEPGAFSTVTALTSTVAFLTPSNAAGATLLAGGYYVALNLNATTSTLTFYFTGTVAAVTSPSFYYQVLRVSSLPNSGY